MNHQGASTSGSTSTTLAAAQLHYTSCQHGVSGHSGFQTRAFTKTINDQEKTEIEQLGVYKPPRDIELMPNGSEQAICPIAVRFKFISDDDVIITRSNYTGQDYTGRSGNYFAHGLKISKIPPHLWPVDLCEHAYWKQELLAAEDVAQKDWELAPLEFTVDPEIFGYEALQEFLSDIDDAESLLQNMIRAIFLRSSTSRSLIINDNLMSRGIFWIACLSKAFPHSVQQKLSCSSYQFDARSCQAINVVFGQTDIPLGENERKFQFFVFDLVTQNHSEIEDSTKEGKDTAGSFFAKHVAHWMVHQPDTLRAFMQLADHFEITELDSNLDVLTNLFLLGCNKVKLSTSALMAVLDLVNKNAKTEKLPAVLDMLAGQEAQFVSITDTQDFNKIAHFVISSFTINQSQALKEMLITLLSKQILHDIDSRQSDHETLQKFVQQATDIDARIKIKIYSKLQLQVEENLKNGEFSGYDTEQLDKLCRAYHVAIQVTENAHSVFESPKWQSFLTLILKSHISSLTQLSWLLDLWEKDLVTETKLVSFICHHLNQQHSQSASSQKDYESQFKDLAEGLHTFYQNRSDDWFTLLKAIKYEREFWPLVVASWNTSFALQKKPLDFYLFWFQQIMNDESEFCLTYRLTFAEFLWSKTPDKKRVDAAQLFIQHNHTNWFDASLLEQTATCINRSISLTKSKTNLQLISSLTRLVSQHGLTLHPDKLTLYKACQQDEIFDTSLLTDVHQALKGCDINLYRSFLGVFVPRQLGLVSAPEQHGYILGNLFLAQYQEELINAYKKQLSFGNKICMGKSSEVFLCFWVMLNSDTPHHTTCQRLRPEMETVLINHFAKVKDRHVNAMFKQLLIHDAFDATQKTHIRNLQNQITVKKNTLLRRIGRSTLSGVKAAAEFTKDGIDKIYQKVRSKNG